MHAPYRIREMTEDDIDPVVDIIELHDDDDARLAYLSFKEYGTEGHVVLADAKNIARGVTGVFPANEQSFWLSWTYLDMRLRGQGFGRKLGDYALSQIKEKGGEVLFVSTSDYKVKGVDIYADAKSFYHAMGAVEEMVIPDYFQRGESHCVYRMQVSEFKPAEAQTFEPLIVQFSGMEPIKETKVAYGLTWEEAPEEHLHRTKKELNKLIDGARSSGSHAVFFAVPSDFDSRQKAIAQTVGFRQVGKLRDFYAPGVDEVHFGYYL